jgi:hypothetical protein
VTDAFYYWDGGWTRGVFIGDTVYAVTETAVRAVPAGDIGATPEELSLE